MADPVLYLSAGGVLVGAALFFFLAFRWIEAGRALEADEFDRCAPESAAMTDAHEPAPMSGAAAAAPADLRSVQDALERLARVHDDRYRRLEKRLEAIETLLAEDEES